MTEKPIVTGGMTVDAASLEARALKTVAAPTKRSADTHLAGLPHAQGMYDPMNEHDACGIGFVANIHNRKSHKIIEDGLKILENLEHRGAVGADPKAGDGAGILIQMPDAFFRKETTRLGFELPAEGFYGVGFMFLPKDEATRKSICDLTEKVVAEEGQIFLGWRDVPVDNSDLGYSVKPTEPFHRQIFIGRAPGCKDQDAFERKLFVIRKRIFNSLYTEGSANPKGLYIPSMSSRTIVYKGMLLAAQVGPLLQGPDGPGHGDGAGACASALLDQHLPDMVAGSSFPHGLPQWRNQHQARQRQLASGALFVNAVRHTGR